MQTGAASSGRKPRLIDVARAAGVSPKTVSNYIHDYPIMSERTVAKVRDAIVRLGYVPNQSAQTLRTGRTGLIGLAVPDLSIPYFAELAGLVTEAAEERGLTLLIDQTKGDRERERRVVSGLGSRTLDGVIVSPMSLSADELTKVDRTMPLVVLGERSHPAGVSYVGVDNVAAARAGTQHLIDLGRTRVAAVGRVSGRAQGTWSYRLQGCVEALRAAGLPVRAEWQSVITRFDREQGADAMTQLLTLDRPPDAVFCFSDLLAVGALLVLHERGVRVPDDVAVIGWDDIEEARFAWPPLSSVRADTVAVARAAVDHLLSQLRGESAESLDTYVDFTVIERASSRGP